MFNIKSKEAHMMFAAGLHDQHPNKLSHRNGKSFVVYVPNPKDVTQQMHTGYAGRIIYSPGLG